MAESWHWEICPACDGGYVDHDGTLRVACTCCDGSGKIKIPNGYQLWRNVNLRRGVIVVPCSAEEGT